MLVGNEGYEPPAFELLQTTELGSPQAVVSFSNLDTQYASDFTHLQLRMHSRTDGSNTEESLLITFNGDTANNYAWHFHFSNGTSQYGSNGVNQPGIYPFATLGGGATATHQAAHIIDILDAFSTNKFSTTRSFAGHNPDPHGTGNKVSIGHGVWKNSAAISSISLDSSAANWASGSRFSLYGRRA
jgi:hypothetical protein